MSLHVKVIAADSMGVRSLATRVDACGTIIGVDMGASLAPRRYGLPPHPLEWEALERALERAARVLEEAEVVIVSHYHYDHYMRDRPELYKGKTLLVKDPKRETNRSQRIRSYRFLVKSGLVEEAHVETADGRVFEFGEVKIEFSRPVWHGEPGTKLGKVLMARITCGGEQVVFASDVQGPVDEETIKVIVDWGRDGGVLILSGPPTYFAGFKVPVEAVERGLQWLMKLAAESEYDSIIVDHHLAREQGFQDRIKAHREEARSRGAWLGTAAEYHGVEASLLEAMRKELWRSHPPPQG